MSAEWNRQLVAVARGMMSCWARRAVAARRDYTQAAYAQKCLERAIEWRDKARRWKMCPI